MNSRKPRRRGVVRAVTARLRGALWPIPVLAVVVAVGIGIGLPAVDGLLESRDSGHPLTFVFGGGPSAARDLLAAIAGSLISVTGLIFSLTVVGHGGPSPVRPGSEPVLPAYTRLIGL